jgi:hypothetical protein
VSWYLTPEPKSAAANAPRPDVARIALMRHEARQKEIEKQFGFGRAADQLCFPFSSWLK